MKDGCNKSGGSAQTHTSQFNAGKDKSFSWQQKVNDVAKTKGATRTPIGKRK